MSLPNVPQDELTEVLPHVGGQQTLASLDYSQVDAYELEQFGGRDPRSPGSEDNFDRSFSCERDASKKESEHSICKSTSREAVRSSSREPVSSSSRQVLPVSKEASQGSRVELAAQPFKRTNTMASARSSRHSRRSTRSTHSTGSIMRSVLTRVSSLGQFIRSDGLEDEDTDFADTTGTQAPVQGEGGVRLTMTMLMLLVVPGVSAISIGSAWLVLELAPDIQSARLWLAILCSIFIILSSVLALRISSAIVTPLTLIRESAETLGDLRYERNWKTTTELAGTRIWISDLRDLLQTFGGIRQSVATFMRYLPDTVVSEILRGEESAMRLHVNKRQVTIMFTDIRDFTSIAEQLNQEDLLFLLTRYISVMSLIIKSYSGVLAEIMGDGLLVFWNTPDDVESHAAKACAAAMAQQHAVKLLNRELPQLGLPEISIRIGINTGRVLTGNLGSESKMKFGCIGDPMNLAARLEGLCKLYGVSVICSKSTYSELPHECGFFCRELDRVQVKGKASTTRIYEVIDAGNADAFLGCGQVVWKSALDDSAQLLVQSEQLNYNPLTSGDVPTNRTSLSSLAAGDVSPEVQKKMELYERGLHLFQAAKFQEACTILQELQQRAPEDQPAALLLDRARKYRDSELSPAELDEWRGTLVLNEK